MPDLDWNDLEDLTTGARKEAGINPSSSLSAGTGCREPARADTGAVRLDGLLRANGLRFRGCRLRVELRASIQNKEKRWTTNS